jgi:ribosomal RNA-processing protein 9
VSDEELSDQNEGDGGGIEDMELRVGSDVGLEGSGEEDDDETPAEKRLRLAKLYLKSVKDGLCEYFSGYGLIQVI